MPIPSMQLDYSRFMDSVMTATQPTQKYPAYAASNPSSVQPTAQGVGGDKGTVLGNLKLGLESFADAAFKLSPSDDVKAWRQSNRAERNKLINTYHDWQAKMRANFPKTYQVSNAIAQGAAPAAQISKLALITIAGVSLAIESGGALTGVALDMMYAATEESIGAFAVGESASISGATVTRAAAGTGALDLSLRDLAGSAKPGVSSTTGSVSKVGVFARSGRSELASSTNLTPEEELAEAISSPEVTRQLDSVSSDSANAREALRTKLRAIQKAQVSADISTSSGNSVKFYQPFRSARTPGETAGSRFVMQYNFETGDLYEWNETYDHSGNVNRVHLKGVNGIPIDSPHFPPTAKELSENSVMLDLSRR